MPATCLVVTSIAGPTPRLRALAAGAAAHGWHFVLVGDEASPARFELPGCEFYGLERQRELRFATAAVCPTRSYARKNLGYLLAMARGADAIVETDDDSLAAEVFWRRRERRRRAHVLVEHGWTNVYRYFSDAPIWPRGFPLEEVRNVAPPFASLQSAEVDAPIQQGLVDDDPDVDAVYRLTGALPIRFAAAPAVALGRGAWCPFNSQNTTWWRDAFPLMYLPATCSFRLTDIWRSFVAQRIAWANGWSVLFHRATVRQLRNDHDLMRDFRDELDGYLANRAICAELATLELPAGREDLPTAMRMAYRALVARGWIADRELELLDAWLADVAAVCVTDGVLPVSSV